MTPKLQRELDAYMADTNGMSADATPANGWKPPEGATQTDIDCALIRYRRAQVENRERAKAAAAYRKATPSPSEQHETTVEIHCAGDGWSTVLGFIGCGAAVLAMIYGIGAHLGWWR